MEQAKHEDSHLILIFGCNLWISRFKNVTTCNQIKCDVAKQLHKHMFMIQLMNKINEKNSKIQTKWYHSQFESNWMHWYVCICMYLCIVNWLLDLEMSCNCWPHRKAAQYVNECHRFWTLCALWAALTASLIYRYFDIEVEEH